MLSVQEVGTQILTQNPTQFYIFAGEEYGIKSRYLEILESFYHRVVESSSVTEVLSLMRVKHLIPLQPTLYVVRYDEEFLTSLDAKSQDAIKHTNIVGTIVCIYEQPKHLNKCAKYLPEFTVSIDGVSSQFIKKYLHTDFPALPDRLIDIAVKSAVNYGQAKNICRSMKFAAVEDLCMLSDDDLLNLFGYVGTSTEIQLKHGIASKNFSFLLQVLDQYSGDADTVLYTILSTMIELDKILDNKHVQSELRDYASRWTHADVYHMFTHAYSALKQLRSYSIADSMDIVIYLAGLLSFTQIPSLEALS